MNKRKYQYLLETIVNSNEKQNGDFKKTSELAAELLCKQLEVSYVGVCIISCDDNDIIPVASFSIKNTRATDANSWQRLAPSQCPDYIAQLRDKRLVDVMSVEEDPRVSELNQAYFKPKGIKSTLDIAIRINGHLEGVLFLEKEIIAPWSDSEIHIATHVADQLALTLATRNAYEKDERLMLLLSADEQAEQVSLLINLKTNLVEYINQAYEYITGTPTQKIIGQHYDQLDFMKQYAEEGALILDKVRDGLSSKGEHELARADGKKYWLRFSVKPFITDRGNHYALVKADDISDEKQYQVTLERLAWRCGLTGLYNRSYFNKELDKTTTGQLILIDICGFKRFNDTYGHQNGDELLIEFARRLKHFANVNRTTQLARVGSDEFAVITHSQNSEDLEYLTTRLYTQLTQQIMIGREHIQPKPAIAIVNIESVEPNFIPLACADIALQYAKKKQGNAVQIFNNALLNTFKEDAGIERDLQTALRGREFELYYQPLKDLKQNTYIGAEALIRWHHPKKGILYPGAFIDIAEQTGMINAIGTWVLEAACKQLNLWQHHQIDLSMHVNVSARQFFSGNLYDQVWNLMSRYRLKPGTLILEITETELMEDIQFATNLCIELSELGVGLAIDDFGTGYSSMRYLKQFPISKLKIDRSFISDLTVSHESREIVSAIIAMASALNISLTAEGVETQEQETFLSEHACHQAQGFLYSPALRESDFSAFLSNANSESIH